jgi:hypothetical protein
MGASVSVELKDKLSEDDIKEMCGEYFDAKAEQVFHDEKDKDGLVDKEVYSIYAQKVITAKERKSGEVDTEMMMVVVSHCVPNFQEWFVVFKSHEEVGMHTNFGLTQSLVGKGPDDTNGNPTCIVIHVFPKSLLEKVQEMFTLTNPPFPDLIAKGLIIEPVNIVFGLFSYDKVALGVDTNVMMRMVIIQHGIPDYTEWLPEFKSRDEQGMHTKAGIVHRIAGQGPNRNGKHTVMVIHTFPKENEEEIQEMFGFDRPPFPDLIAAGIIVLPITKTYASVVMDKKH